MFVGELGSGLPIFPQENSYDHGLPQAAQLTLHKGEQKLELPRGAGRSRTSGSPGLWTLAVTHCGRFFFFFFFFSFIRIYSRTARPYLGPCMGPCLGPISALSWPYLGALAPAVDAVFGGCCQRLYGLVESSCKAGDDVHRVQMMVGDMV
eukprot:FR744150.1.p2 GENE.FR744150.1~~FR744150.1.p2  ORF type:complete len:150 (-),score=23.09 FR744150.1:487-936(-)